MTQAPRISRRRLLQVGGISILGMTLPDLLRPIAEWNPVSVLTAATRQLWGNPNPFAATGFPAENPLLLTLVWIVLLLAIFIPLGVRSYRNISR